jgi:hypothetical protein
MVTGYWRTISTGRLGPGGLGDVLRRALDALVDVGLHGLVEGADGAGQDHLVGDDVVAAPRR